MSLVNLIDTTFTAKNISTALSVYEYTVPGSGLWYHLYFQVRLYQVAGGGDYTINLRLNDGDALADDPMVPKTTYTAAAGAQNIWFQGEAFGGSGDVFNIMCAGLAGDTAVVGSIRIFHDNAVGATTYGNKLDVSTTGEAGLDFDNIKAATAPTTLTNITVPIVTTTATATAVTTLNGIANGAITAAAIATGAIDADAIADNAIDAGAIASDAITAAKIAADAVTEIQSGLATPAGVWTYASRTLTQAAASVVSAVSGSTITIQRGDTLSASLSNIGSLVGYVSVDFTVKANLDDTDAEALLRIRLNASTLSDGLLIVNGATATSEADGSITITDEPTGDITIGLAASVTDDLEEGSYTYDVQMITATAVTTRTAGVCKIVRDVTRAVV